MKIFRKNAGMENGLSGLLAKMELFTVLSQLKKDRFTLILRFGLLCLPFINLFAQNAVVRNHPKYYQDGDYWVQALVPWNFEERIHDYETEGAGENFSLYFFYVEGDTIIDNKEYKCVHAKTWVYDCEETYNHQPEGLIEGVQVSNLLFMREDADGKQWRRLSYLTDEALLFDFSHPFEKGQVIRFCKHDHLSDVLENVCYESVQTKAYSNSSRLNKALRSDDKAPEGYLYYNLEVSNVTTLELPNGEQVPFANGRIAFGWGDVYQGDLLHQFVPVCESFSGRFLYRVHQGQVVLQKQDNINRISSIIGTDVLSLINNPTGIIRTSSKVNLDEHSNTIYDLQGRKVNSKIINSKFKNNKEIYIQNGKKVAVK